MRTWLFDKLWIKSLISRHVGIDSKRVLFSEHHLSHAASAYFCSPFEESAVLTFDGVGEWATTSMGLGRGSDLTISREIHCPHSVGLLYSAFTAFLGFEVNDGEYKVMGMAPYGSPRYVDQVWRVVEQNGNGAFRLNPDYFSFHHSTHRAYSHKFTGLFGDPRDPDVPFFTNSGDFPSYYGSRPRNFDELCVYNQHYADIAASEFPYNAIRFCLDQGELMGADLDYVVFFEKPFVKFDRLLRTTLQGFPKTHSLFLQSMRTWLFDKDDIV